MLCRMPSETPAGKLMIQHRFVPTTLGYPSYLTKRPGFAVYYGLPPHCYLGCVEKKEDVTDTHIVIDGVTYRILDFLLADSVLEGILLEDEILDHRKFE